MEKCVCCASLFSVRARERKRESKQEEREKSLEAKKMKENENTETSGLFFFERVGLNLDIWFLG